MFNSVILGIRERTSAVESFKAVLDAKLLKSWSPVFVPVRLFNLLMSKTVILAASLALNVGSFSVIVPVMVSAVFACKAKGTLNNWLVPVIV